MISKKQAYFILRATMGIIFITHGLARLYYGSVSDFGGFMNAQGFIIGLSLAWIITIGEIICGGLLVLGRYVRYCVIFHAVIIIGGLILIHIPEGWFVVGHGSGGSEYSMLILAVLALIYSHESN
jgi:putative oxidoreductase